MTHLTPPHIYKFKDTGYQNVGEIVDDYLKTKFENKITSFQKEKIMQTIVSHTNDAIKKGIINHKLYDPSKTGKDQITEKWFKKGDKSDIDLVVSEDQVVLPEELNEFLKNTKSSELGKKNLVTHTSNSSSKAPINRVKDQLNANIGNKISNSKQFQKCAEKIAIILNVNTKNTSSLGHALGSTAGGSITFANGITNFDASRPIGEKNNAQAIFMGIQGACSTLNGLICSLEEAPRREFFRAFYKLGNNIKMSTSGLPGEQSLATFFSEIDDLLKKIDSPSAKQKFNYWLGRVNEKYMLPINAGHKDMFNGLGMLINGGGVLFINMVDIYKKSCHEKTGELNFEIFEENLKTSSPELIKGALFSAFGYKSVSAYAGYEKMYRTQSASVKAMYENHSPKRIHEMNEELAALDAKKTKITNAIAQKKRMLIELTFKRQNNQSMPNLERKKIQDEIKFLKNKELRIALKAKEISGNISILASHLNEIKEKVSKLRADADIKSAALLKRGFIAGEIMTGVNNIKAVDKSIEKLRVERDLGSISVDEYNLLIMASHVKQKTTILSSGASVALMSGKVSSPVGWGVAGADMFASWCMPKQADIDNACMDAGLRPEFNPYAMNNHSFLEFTTACIIANSIHHAEGAIISSFDKTKKKTYECYQILSKKYYDITWEIIKNGGYRSKIEIENWKKNSLPHFMNSKINETLKNQPIDFLIKYKNSVTERKVTIPACESTNYKIIILR